MAQSLTVLREGHNCQRIAPCRRAAFLIDGEAYFKAFVEVLKSARQSIYILGWDFDSRIRLIRDPGHPDSGAELGPFLNSLLQRNPELHIYILDWDFPMIYALEREPLPIFRIGMRGHQRLHFEMDSQHPVGASQHQKVVVVDDQLAFVGGLDLASCRWDTQEHCPDDDRRVDSGKRYQPFHDVQMMVEGEVARVLGDLCRHRWRKATGQVLSSPAEVSISHWPLSVEPDIEDLMVGVARTEPAWEHAGAIHEVENLYLDAIRASRNHIYIENQYLTSGKIGESLALRLDEKNGPEVIVLLPRKCSGWLEEGTMGVLRARLLKKLQSRDPWGRLRVYYPSRRDLGDEFINLHAKILIIDDTLLRIGSSNMNNRSMGLDSECDLVIEAGEEDRIKKKIQRFRNRLLAEHCGASLKEIEGRLFPGGRLAELIDSFKDNQRHLAPLEPEVDDLVDKLIPDAELIDPEKPIKMDDLVTQFAPEVWEKEQGKIRVSSRMIKIIIILLLVFSLYLAWEWTPLGAWLNAENLAAWGDTIEQMPFTPLIVMAAYVLGGLVLFPVTVLILATILTFGPLAGFLYALAGSFVSALTTYFIGRKLSRQTIRNLIGKRLNRLSRRLVRNGLLTMITVRIVPVAPFSIVNIVAGASRIRFRDFFWGSLIGMFPGILVLAAAGKGLVEIFFTNESDDLVPAIVFFAVAVTVIVALRRLLKKKEENKSSEKSDNDRK